MTGQAETMRAGRGSAWRLGAWAILTAAILAVPLAAMQFTDEVDWTAFDFAFAAILIFGSGSAFELLTRRAGSIAYKAGIGFALLAGFLLIWINGAVGIIGSEDNEANLLYGGVVAIGAIGAVAARFRPAGMAATMFVAALAQVAIGAAALLAGWGTDGAIWPRDVIGATGMFAALWLLSAALFRKAARG